MDLLIGQLATIFEIGPVSQDIREEGQRIVAELTLASTITKDPHHARVTRQADRRHG